MLPFKNQDLHTNKWFCQAVVFCSSNSSVESLFFCISWSFGIEWNIYLDCLPEDGNLTRQVVVLNLQSFEMCFHLHKISVRDDVHYVVHDFLYGVFQKFDKLNMPIAPCYRRIYPEDVFKDPLWSTLSSNMALTFGYQNVLSDEIYDPSGTKNMGSVSHLWIGLAGVHLVFVFVCLFVCLWVKTSSLTSGLVWLACVLALTTSSSSWRTSIACFWGKDLISSV